MDFLDEVAKAVEECGNQCDLGSFAAVAAMQELRANWRDAINDGADPKALVGDIGDVIMELSLLHKKLRAIAQ